MPVYLSSEQQLNIDSDIVKAYRDLRNDGRTNSVFSFCKGNMLPNIDGKKQFDMRVSIELIIWPKVGINGGLF
jgi:hypothetical protein